MLGVIFNFVSLNSGWTGSQGQPSIRPKVTDDQS